MIDADLYAVTPSCYAVLSTLLAKSKAYGCKCNEYSMMNATLLALLNK